jgi:hypothetical protein
MLVRDGDRIKIDGLKSENQGGNIVGIKWHISCCLSTGRPFFESPKNPLRRSE